MGLNLEKQVFGHGTLYVGLSRATTREGVRIYQPLDKRIQSKQDDPSGTVRIKNVICREFKEL